MKTNNENANASEILASLEKFCHAKWILLLKEEADRIFEFHKNLKENVNFDSFFGGLNSKIKERIDLLIFLRQTVFQLDLYCAINQHNEGKYAIMKEQLSIYSAYLEIVETWYKRHF